MIVELIVVLRQRAVTPLPRRQTFPAYWIYLRTGVSTLQNNHYYRLGETPAYESVPTTLGLRLKSSAATCGTNLWDSNLLLLQQNRNILRLINVYLLYRVVIKRHSVNKISLILASVLWGILIQYFISISFW